ncbi:MAG: N4-gp56 family major capsid protein [Ruminococcus sp.]|nr:N4-gp56 family major capsid protein [Ruminococcus sp.]
MNGQSPYTNDLSPEMKVFYDKTLLKFAKPNLVHDQFAQKRNIPKNGGKTIEFRRYSQLPKALTPLTEGVTPDGQNLNVTTVTATVAQYGGYITLSDMLLLTAIDNNLVEAIELLGDQAGRTLDTITREILCGGTNVIYGSGDTVSARTSITSAMKLTVGDIKRAVRRLKVGLAKPINGYYVAIVHPDVVYDLENDDEWIEASQYAGSTQIFEGEIGKLYGVRFVESTEAKIWAKAGASNISVYATLVMGANAYGTTNVEGGGLESIVKQLGSGGTADPLNQRATAGWKAIKTAEILYNDYLVRIESASTFSNTDEGAAN